MDNLPGDILRLLISNYIYNLDLPNFIALNKRSWLLKHEEKIWSKLYIKHGYPLNHVCLKGPQFKWFQRVTFVTSNLKKCLQQLKCDAQGANNDQLLAGRILNYIYNLHSTKKIEFDTVFRMEKFLTEDFNFEADVNSVLKSFLKSVGYEFVDNDNNYKWKQNKKRKNNDYDSNSNSDSDSDSDSDSNNDNEEENYYD